MKAADRCRATNQGDRCRKSAAEEHDIHEGAFSIWKENKFREEKFPLRHYGPRIK